MYIAQFYSTEIDNDDIVDNNNLKYDHVTQNIMLAFMMMMRGITLDMTMLSFVVVVFIKIFLHIEHLSSMNNSPYR